jgi:hypothetical protein
MHVEHLHYTVADMIRSAAEQSWYADLDNIKDVDYEIIDDNGVE